MTTSAISPYQLPHPGDFSPLPPETLIKIFQTLDFKSAVSFGRTSTILYQLQEKTSLWKYFFIRDFFSGTHEEKPLDFAWKPYYQYFEIFLLLPFPGKRAVFKLIKDENWSIHHEGANLVRLLSFESETNDSLIKDFQLLGYANGKIHLNLTLSDSRGEVEDYFDAVIYNGKKRMVLVDNWLRFEQPSDRRKIYKILKEFNEIPAEYLGLVEKLCFAANWRSVTPLTPKETTELMAEIDKYENSLDPSNMDESLLTKLLRPLIQH